MKEVFVNYKLDLVKNLLCCSRTGSFKGPSIYDVHTEGQGVRLRWTGGGVQPHVDIHTEN